MDALKTLAKLLQLASVWTAERPRESIDFLKEHFGLKK